MREEHRNHRRAEIEIRGKHDRFAVAVFSSAGDLPEPVPIGIGM
jgi:hypothetical protein